MQQPGPRSVEPPDPPSEPDAPLSSPGPERTGLEPTGPSYPRPQLDDEEPSPDAEEDDSAAASPSMTPQLERLQEQLRASVARSERGMTRSVSLSEAGNADNDEYLSMISRRERSRSTSTDSRSTANAVIRGKGKGKSRPVSVLLPTSTWSDQLAQLAFPSRKSHEEARSRTPSSSGSYHTPSSSGFASTTSADSVTPKRASSSPTLKLGQRASRPSPTASLRQSMRLPFLPSIPASPLPPILSPGLTRSSSSPPVLPAIVSTAAFSPTLELTPPSADLSPAPACWPNATDPPSLVRSATSASAPNLSLLTSAPIEPESPTSSVSNDDLAPSSQPLARATGELLTFDPELLIPDSPIIPISLSNTTQRTTSKNDERRYHALVELVGTEAGYLEHLRALVKVYFQTLPFLTLLSLGEVEAIVRNAESILELHERIAERIDAVELELAWQNSEDQVEPEKQQWKIRKATRRIAQIFVDELPNFHLYNNFCARHAEALDLTRRVAARPEWEAYERQCALRVATGGDMTPLASRANSTSASPFFPTVALPTLSSSLPEEPTLASQASSTHVSPVLSVAALPVSSSVPTSTHSEVSRSSRAKLRFTDFAIAPVQRIMRYPMIFGSLAKYCQEDVADDDANEVWAALSGLKQVAARVDEAKREREGEIRTRIVANRMEFQSTVSTAFCDILGPTLLVGALHVLHRSSAIEGLRVKYYGCFLYRSHLILAKIKKRASYEPREWLPLRLFDITSLEEGQGLLSQSIRLSYQDHILELGSLCPAEKAIWLRRLIEAQTEAQRQWDVQALDEKRQPTLFDETLISSVSPSVSLQAAATPVRKGHSRSASSISVTSALAAAAASTSSSPFIAQDEPLPALPSDSLLFSNSAQLASINSATSGSLGNRHRFSTTASSLLGRTPSAQRAAVDLRLADVFSEECLTARAQASRETAEADEVGRRMRTMSGPKRSMTAGFSGTHHSSSVSSMTGKMLGSRDRRRMSSYELEMGRRSVSDLKGAIGFDASVSALYREDSASPSTSTLTPATTPERKWANAIRKTKSASSRARPALPEIDTTLAATIGKATKGGSIEKQAPLTATGSTPASWKAKADSLRRVASHSSLDGSRKRSPALSAFAASQPATSISSISKDGATGAADVERNNSVSSTTSSNGTATNSSSSHSQGLHLIETPPSSIPPSPDLCAIELAEPYLPGSSTLKPSLSTRSNGSRWALQEGMSNVFRIKRRKSTLGLAPIVGSEERPQAPPHTRSTTSDSSQSASSQRSNSDSSSNTAGAKLTRRSSTLGGYFQKRVQSSPTLTGFFASALGSTSSPHLPLTLSSAPPSSVALNSYSPTIDAPTVATSPSSGSFSFHTPTSQPGTPESGTASLPAVVNAQTMPDTTSTSTVRKKGALAGKVGRTVSSTIQHMARQRSSEGTTNVGFPSSPGLPSRRFHFSRQNGMTPLS
ncbi:uncharacterized protein JCM15063_005525 [Sporobolomyces koalae]|uniref:uncharacterized protein n=1 Tax=Sporobolomyces koalae TaxID=500713 RepID=UPI003181A198